VIKSSNGSKDCENDQHLPETPPCAEYLNQRAHAESRSAPQPHRRTQAKTLAVVVASSQPGYLSTCALEDVAPAHNVLLGRAALAPCHVYQQYLVSPGETPDAPLRLSLHLTQRSSDVPIGLPVNIAQYALLPPV
jgi:hypothetical protein